MIGRIVNTVATTVLVSFIALSSYWYFERDPYVVFTIPKPIQIIYAGENISYQRYVCPLKEVEATIRVELASKTEKYSLKDYKFSKDFCGIYTFSAEIPKGIKSGTYEYRVSAKYNVNPMKSATKNLEPIYFEVM